MQQRPTSCLSRAADDNSLLKPKHSSSSSSSPRRIAMDETPQLLPVYFPSSSFFRRSASEKLVHLIPIIVFLCLLCLWWFSYPVNLVMKDGKIVGMHHLQIRQPVDSTNRVELAIMASTISPVPPLPHNLTTTTQQAAHSLNTTNNTKY